MLLFPREFPFKPPAIYMLTPNGRFRPNTRLCLSISDFHPDSWNPTWSVSTILAGLLSFMLEKTPTFGSIVSSPYEKQQFAVKSLAFNLRDPTFCELFPEIVEEIKGIIGEIPQEELKPGMKTMSPTSKVRLLALEESETQNETNEVVRSQHIKMPANSLYQQHIEEIGHDANLRHSWQPWYTNAVIICCFGIFVILVYSIIQNL